MRPVHEDPRGAPPGARAPAAEAEAATAGASESGRWLTPGVASAGAAGFFAGAGHGSAGGRLRPLLSSTLPAGPGALGAIGGVSAALPGVAKLGGGPLASDPTRRA